MSSNKYVTLSLYFTLPPGKSPAEAIVAVNRFIKEKLCIKIYYIPCVIPWNSSVWCVWNRI